MIESIKERKILVGGATVLALAVTFALFFGFDDFIGLTITGLSVFRPEESPQESFDGVDDGDESFVALSDPSVEENETLPWWWGLDGRPGGSGKNDEEQNIFLGYRAIGLEPSLSLWFNGAPIDITNSFFEGMVHLTLSKDDVFVSSFDVDFSGDVLLSDLIGDSNESLGMSFIHTTSNAITNKTLYIPRHENHTQVRVCGNASSFVDIGEGCGENEAVSYEEVVSLLDSRLTTSEDGLFFVLSDVSGTGGSSELDSLSPTITLSEPALGSGDADGAITFSYLAADASLSNDCMLLVDGSVVAVTDDLDNWESTEIGVENLSAGEHFWQVSCSDMYGNDNVSDSRIVSVIPMTSFDGQTTDLSQEYIEAVENFTLELSTAGMIQFDDVVNLSGGFDIDSHVRIEPGFISVDSDVLPELNRSAELTFYDVNVENPVVFVDGTICEECVILDSSNDDVRFSVPHFSNYTLSENSQLTIFDSTDSEIRYPGDHVSFFGNYTNITNSASINGTGVGCNVTFSDTGTQVMTYNETSRMYEFNRSFGSEGVYSFELFCDGSALGYTGLNGTDFASINLLGSGPSGASVSVVNTSTASADAPENSSAQAGNISELTIGGFSTTQSWQGYYGNVSGTIQLVDGNDAVLYNWSAASPQGEVYATHAFDINFPTIGCANATHIQQEEGYLNQLPNDVDSVSQTFNESSHPGFFVGATSISANSCNSTNLYTSSGPQSSSFYEVLLGDGALQLVYVALLEEDVIGFDGRTHDFEMIVGEDGHSGNTAVTPYYFYVELQ